MNPLKTFFCYAPEDKSIRQALEKHLSVLTRSMLITTWHDRQIQVGINWQQEIDSHLESTDLILPLVSSDFLRSDYCSGAEMKRALERHNTGAAYVLPILVRPVDWDTTPFTDLAVLPTGGKPVSMWPDRDDALLDVTMGVDRIVAKIRGSSLPKEPPPSSEYSHPGPAIQKIANLLEMRKESNHATVLLLGSRAGKLFRSAVLYEVLQPFSQRNFDQLSHLEQFRECFHILTSNKFDETDIHSLLHSSLRNIGNADADILLATLLKYGYFHEIITTNIDNSLEGAMLTVGMKEGRDYEVTRSTRNLIWVNTYIPYHITKAFGDFSSKDYIIKRNLYLDNNQSLKGFLQSTLSGDVLAVGIDPVWDQDILRIIPTIANGSVWLVSEEEDIIDKSPDLAALLHKRPSARILGHEGSYDSFISKIHNYLRGSNFSSYRHHIAKTADLQLNMEEKLTNLMGMLPTMEEQLTRLTTMLSTINDQLQPQQNENRTLFNQTFREVQAIQRQLAVIKEQLQAN
jgi:hypothetical protein